MFQASIVAAAHKPQKLTLAVQCSHIPRMAGKGQHCKVTQEPHLIGEADAQAKHDPADDEHGQVHSACLQGGSNDEQGSPDRHCPPPPKHPAQIDMVTPLLYTVSGASLPTQSSKVNAANLHSSMQEILIDAQKLAREARGTSVSFMLENRA